MKLLKSMFALLLCVVAGISLSSCTKSGSNQSASATTDGTTNGYPLTADNLTPSDSNPKAAPPPPAPPPPPPPTNGGAPQDGNSVNLTPDQAQPCFYVTTQAILHYQANDTKKISNFAAVNAPITLDKNTTPIESITCKSVSESIMREALAVGGLPGNWGRGQGKPGPSLQIELEGTITYKDHKTDGYIAGIGYFDGYYVVTGLLHYSLLN